MAHKEMGGSVKSPQSITLWWTAHKALYNLYGRKATFKMDFCKNKIAKSSHRVVIWIQCSKALQIAPGNGKCYSSVENKFLVLSELHFLKKCF